MCATRTTSASGAASSAARKPPGRGASTFVIASARCAIRSRPSLRSRAIARSRRCGGEVAALGEDHERVVLRRARWPAPRSVTRGPRPRPGLGEMNRAGIRCSSTSIAGSHCRVSLRTTRGSRSYQYMSAWISVNESPGPACRQQTSSGVAGVRVRRRPLGGDVEPQHPLGLAEEHPHHALHQVVVEPLPVRRAHPPAEAGGQPVAEHDHEQQRVDRRRRGSTIQSRRSAPPAAGQQRRERGRGDQPERQQHPEQGGDRR